MKIESTPASRWAQNYKKRYLYNLGGALIFFGLIFLFGSIFLGLGLMGIGGYIIYKNKKYWEGKE